ncbi:MAG TPA: EAL domain-containing protein [Thermodesulfovibrionales bacterium]|nr:EAL domain-containing protein [Thermodesulfovibrionales bacterium]
MPHSGKKDEAAELFCKGSCTMEYQPILELGSGKTFGFEALLRGMNGTPVPFPEPLFSAEAQRSDGNLLRLDLSCVGSALRHGRELSRDHTLFINAYAQTLQYLSCNVSLLVQLLTELGIDPRKIVFEISEKTDLAFARNVEKSLCSLVELGVHVAIDDIGGSFNWLHHMLNMKPAFLKVDKAFIYDIHLSKRKQALVRSLNLMCQAMGLQVIAEGIEGPKQLQFLNEIGVAYAQGFWFGNPGAAGPWVKK